MRRFLLRGGRVVVHTVVGGVLVGAGLVMLLTPGPGIVTIVLGLAVLAREYDWADRLKRFAISQVRDASTAARARLAARRGNRDAHVDTPDGAELIDLGGDDTADEIAPAS